MRKDEKKSTREKTQPTNNGSARNKSIGQAELTARVTVKGIVTDGVDAGIANATHVPPDKAEVVTTHHRELAKNPGKGVEVNIEEKAIVGSVKAGMFNLNFAIDQTKMRPAVVIPFIALLGSVAGIVVSGIQLDETADAGSIVGTVASSAALLVSACTLYEALYKQRWTCSWSSLFRCGQTQSSSNAASPRASPKDTKLSCNENKR